MRAVIQRVTAGQVTVDKEVIGTIEKGLVVLLAVGQEDSSEDVRYMAEKIANLRIFEDEASKMNRSVIDAEGKILLVSQFTLYGDCRKGRRPSFMEAASPDQALALFGQVKEKLEAYGLTVETGRFQASMVVQLSNDGPVTMLLDSKKTF
ncbi:D-aminoacyl-tRNA deacylase [Heliorestis convoluta]|uniref:D-aminoacyl-tRNA deacylase n=1 Tax=Heliorestis convoluta TaxID=356322 RepID=A0A5Q2MXU9_9FIRM|nr:D-aminoacyl-tRNA deacylase [Heliorestis convoluta]QGG46701.1 D-tyrosyl-tRNA(Tyr) deacylase [Heliorestis convoluta]